MTQTVQSFAYEEKNGGAVLLRCFSRDSKAEIPERIEGLPVRELGPYAFSAHMEETDLRRGLAGGRIRQYIPGWLAGQELPALCGARLEEAVLPDSLQSVGKYCFYNCSGLRRLSFSGGLQDWGSGVFTGCHRIGQLQVAALPDGSSHLKEVLDELREELEVDYLTAGERARLVFPEFYEEGVENTPARILETHVHGSGILYRNCFYDRKPDYAQYDALFLHACAQESEALLLRMACCRLRWPRGLSAKAREQYERFVCGHAGAAGFRFLSGRDLEGLLWLLALCRGRIKQPEELKALTESLSLEAARLGFTQAQSHLMEFGHRQGHAGRRRLEL